MRGRPFSCGCRQASCQVGVEKEQVGPPDLWGVFSKESVLGKYLQKVEIQKLVSLKLYAPVYPLKRLCVLEARTPHSEGHGPEGECVSFSTWHRAQPAFVCISSPAGTVPCPNTHTFSYTTKASGVVRLGEKEWPTFLGSGTEEL